ncbi:MAG: sugar phosphate isomerase [Chitinophagales bacterium]|nr:MAG: sugar phosphate isomerase [Chitinophagales bacterium]
MRIGSKYQLTYCTNVHPAESWDETFTQLKRHLPVIKKAVAGTELFAVGLYLSDQASRQILQGEAIAAFRDWLHAEGCYILTMNGFPYGGFHQQRVKDKVYHPDWLQLERVHYTQRLFRILSALTPEAAEGSISTVPLSYKYWYENEDARKIACTKASLHLATIAYELHTLHAEYGKFFHLDLEPEPDCFLENAEDVIHFFEYHLLPEGKSFLKQKGFTAIQAEDLLRRHIQLCYDVCHFSVKFQDPDQALKKIIAAGINIGKVQVSAALKAICTEDTLQEITDSLKPFDEPRYFHQSVIRNKSGQLKHYRDLGEALDNIQPDAEELRTHFHIPVFTHNYGRLHSTQQDILETFAVIKKHNLNPHFEAETYTWEVLPENLKTELSQCITRELKWIIQNLSP